MSQVQAHNKMFNESGHGFNPHDATDAAQARAAVEARMADLMGRAAEVRAAWNAAVAANTVNGKVSMQALAKIEAAAGATQLEMSMLKARGAFN